MSAYYCPASGKFICLINQTDHYLFGTYYFKTKDDISLETMDKYNALRVLTKNEGDSMINNFDNTYKAARFDRIRI